MPVINLVPGIVPLLRCPEGKQKIAYHDRTVPGLVLNITRHNTKSFAYRYRDRAGVQREQLLGRASHLSLQEARARATLLREKLRRPEPAPKVPAQRGSSLMRGLQRVVSRFVSMA